MAQRRRAVDLEPGIEWSEDGGTHRAYFPVLDLTGAGATPQEAHEELAKRILNIVETSEEARDAFMAYAEQHSVEIEEPVQQGGDTVARAKEAMAPFPALTGDSFDDGVAGDPVLVDFWAEWCMPCHMAAPTIRELHDTLDGRMRVAKLNIDEHPQVAERFGVQSIPTMILFRGGEERHRITGAGRSLQQLRAEVEPHLG